ncbi:hypothetical protein GCM10027073_16320 [Streptomyces chlorus]
MWSARCGESRTAGAGSGPEKRPGRKAGTALRADFTHWSWTIPASTQRAGRLPRAPCPDDRADRLLKLALARLKEAGLVHERTTQCVT